MNNLRGKYFRTKHRSRKDISFLVRYCQSQLIFIIKNNTPSIKCLSKQYRITKTRLFKYTENFPTKNENFQIKNSDIFHIFAQNIDCGYSLEPPQRDRSNEYPQSMFWAEIRKIMYTPVNPSFTKKKWGLRGSKLYRRVFVMERIRQCLKCHYFVVVCCFVSHSKPRYAPPLQKV